MNISLCMIVKDDSELNDLQQAINSVIDQVKSVCITANGKETAQIEQYMSSLEEKYPKKTIKYDYLKWNDDFSEQRTHNFNQAPKDTDYIFWMDADDRLVGASLLIKIARLAKQKSQDVVFLTYWYGCTFNGEPSIKTFKHVDVEHQRERLIRPGTIKWVGRLHETPVPISGQKDKYAKIAYDEKEFPIAIMHTATIDDAMQKMNRNQRILEMQLEEEREKGEADPRTLLYLMKIYSEKEESTYWKRCLIYGKEYLEKSGWDEERANACDIMAVCSIKLGDNNSAIKFLHDAIEEYPHQPIHYIRLALAYFNESKYREAKHWMDIAGKIELDGQTAGINNITEMKVLYTQLMLKIAYNVDKDTERSLALSKKLLEVQPNEENKKNVSFLMDMVDWKKACDNTRQLLEYLESIGANKSAMNLLDSLPEAIAKQPFAVSFRRKIQPSRVWGKKEICYFANFGGQHFEKWDGRSLKQGIGGSETAVIKLAEDWAKKGYKVTVYGDPTKMGDYNGVNYQPWYYFNKADVFNIFIQWRGANLAPLIKANKFYVDLHDVVAGVDYTEDIINAVDGIFFKSQYHRDMISQLPDDKAFVVGNGINV